MIEYAKIILPKVCGWKELFCKELIKCYNWLPENEIHKFHFWCYVNFYQLYPDILGEVFNGLPQKSITKQDLHFLEKGLHRASVFCKCCSAII